VVGRGMQNVTLLELAEVSGRHVQGTLSSRAVFESRMAISWMALC
jgi:hypothetical protein